MNRTQLIELVNDLVKQPKETLSFLISSRITLLYVPLISRRKMCKLLLNENKSNA